ncbi:MAG: TIGR01212 family radical SAM protein [Clostridia bacterium]|nr:TIGR01212 family radical SAM protein [Clostridia bacterium]
MYRTLNTHYLDKFGSKVYKLSIDLGFSCPNRDGTISTGGCIFCSSRGGGEFAERGESILSQLERAKFRVEAKSKSGKYIAYLQAFSNTYAPISTLREVYYEAISPDYIVGLSIATRPDCLSDDVVDLISEINLIKPVSVELGLQTVHEETATLINRGYPLTTYLDAVRRLKDKGIEVVTHIILGLPGESEDMMIETTRQVVDAGTDGVKFHLLHVLKGTRLADMYARGEFECLSMQDYASILKKCIEILPPHVVVHRITGDGAKRDLIAPLWSADKKKVLNYLNHYLSD